MSIEILQHQYDLAMKKVHDRHTRGADLEAAAAYTRLVRAGAASPLKRKYRSSSDGKQKSGHNDQGHRRLGKLSETAKAKLPPQPPVMLVVDGLTGKSRVVVG